MRGLFLVFTVLFSLLNFTVQAEETRAVEHYNTQRGLALKGYDPVSYFAEGGDRARPGRRDITLNYDGVIYRFATYENREIFQEDPAKYEPTYGGWCAWAMRSGRTVDIDPTLYTINGRRIHFFIRPSTKANFDADIEKYEALADREWKNISGEKPRQ